MSTLRYPIRKSGVCGFIRQNVSIASSDGVLSGPVSDSVACYSGKLKIVPIFGGGIFHHSTLRRIGSVLPGLPVRVVGQELFGDDRIGTSIGLTVGCGRCPPMGERHGSGVLSETVCSPACGKLAARCVGSLSVYGACRLCCCGTTGAAGAAVTARSVGRPFITEFV